ncbi:hypothetical protein Ade02nite_41480 [Paractinoplanes deccanensis]|uniref:Response regulatory domain-containing protein n=1 Tax=Paractinoplanes deccanensis TaxID=113561 RepID=A0ABQ3Y680_9ACTN|nr:response regulator [Actinoplanes deccanensis]GID75507.1 hypothetical protein Ade02nite_41480 [Actinoplanes deccanensis]
MRLSFRLDEPAMGSAWQPGDDPVVLVADDDEDVRDLMTFKLERAGFRVIAADNGATALDLVRSSRPDAVILDIDMPGLDGLTVCHQLRASAATTGIPVLMVSGRGRDLDVDFGFHVGAGDYVVKPFKPDDLLRRLRLLLLGGS